MEGRETKRGVRVRFGGMTSGDREQKQKTPEAWLDLRSLGTSRYAVGRVIPWRVARQQSPPPFHPAPGQYGKSADETRAMLPVRKAGKSVAKEGLFFVQTMGSTSGYLLSRFDTLLSAD